MSANTGKTLRRLIGLRTGTRLMDGCDFSISAASSNVSEITITPKYGYGSGAAITAARTLTILLSDNASGYGLTATTASGAVATKTAGTTGTDLAVLTTKKALLVQTNASGQYVLSITDSAKTAFNVVVVDPFGHHYVQPLTTASYG